MGTMRSGRQSFPWPHIEVIYQMMCQSRYPVSEKKLFNYNVLKHMPAPFDGTAGKEGASARQSGKKADTPSQGAVIGWEI
jgi:hypothetical protein